MYVLEYIQKLTAPYPQLDVQHIVKLCTKEAYNVGISMENL